MTRTFTVPILLPADPTAALQAATKQYVDASASGGIGTVNAFTYSSTITEPPASAGLRMNSVTMASVTRLWISQTTFDGLDAAIGLGRISPTWQIYIQDYDDSTKWVIFNVTAKGTDKGAYWEFAVTYDSGPGALVNNQKIAVQSITPANHGLPTGGVDGDVLTKTSSADYAVAWETPGTTNPGNFFSFQFNVATTAPTSGSQIRLNNATQTDATVAYVRYVASDGTDVHNRLLLSGLGDVLFIQDRNDSTRWQSFDITGDPTDVPASSYVSVPVAFREGGSALIDQAVIAQVLWGGGSGGGGGTPVGTKMTALTALAGASIAGTDIVEVVDISDTTMAGSGTNKKTTFTDLVTYFNTNLTPATPANVTDGDKGEITVTSGVWAIEANAVTNTKMADNAVGTAEIIDRSVTAVKQPQAGATTFKGNSTGSTADIADISVYTAQGMLRRPVINNTSTAVAPVLGTHENTMVTLSNASPVVVTLPSDATSNFPIGSEVDFLWLGVGSCSFAQGSSAVIVSSATVVATPVMRIRYSAATAKKIAANTWLVAGDLA